jgi:hypothetical protein
MLVSLLFGKCSAVADLAYDLKVTGSVVRESGM